MNPEENQDSDQPAENWLQNFEDECLDELDSEPNMEDRLQAEKEYAVKKLWLTFQNSATAIAQLYKDRQQGLSTWLPFQSAALSLTNLYKDSIDSLQTCVEFGIQCGKQHKTRDIIAWARKKRRHIRREELVAFLCGKTAPPRNHRHSSSSMRPIPRVGLERSSPRVPQSESDVVEQDLDAFREAIALQGLNGAMSNISVGYGAHAGGPQPAWGNIEELNRFIHDEFSRNVGSRKRTTSPDVVIDSPSRKRSRLL